MSPMFLWSFEYCATLYVTLERVAIEIEDYGSSGIELGFCGGDSMVQWKAVGRDVYLMHLIETSGGKGEV